MKYLNLINPGEFKLFRPVFIFCSALLLSIPGKTQIKNIPVQSFDRGWLFTSIQFNVQKVKTGDSAQQIRGLGDHWSDQFNIESVNIGQESVQGLKMVPGKTKGQQYKALQKKVEGLQWEKVMLPHVGFKEPVPIESPKEGLLFYKKYFLIPKDIKGKIVQLQFDGAMQMADIWVNGQFVQQHEGGYLPFTLDLTEYLQYGKLNSIFIRLDNRPSPVVPPGKPVKSLDFIYYSGIYRNVRMFITDPLHITLPETVNKPGGGGVFVHYLGAERYKDSLVSMKETAAVQAYFAKNARVKTRTNVINQGTTARRFLLEQCLFDIKQKRKVGQWRSALYTLAPGEDTTIEQTVRINEIRLWSLEDPYRYQWVSRIAEKGSGLEEVANKVGFRTLVLSRNKGVRINGKLVKILGSNRHMSYPWLGNALSANANIRDAVLIKKAGMNAIRSGHYPQDPSFYAACDSLGILIIDCIPGWQFYNKANDFQQKVFSDIRQMVYRDRNHPSVFLWETSLNEAYPPKAFRVKQAKVAHKAWQDSTDFYTSGDSYFMKAAWDVPYDDWNGDPGDRNNSTYPDRPFLIREYGDYEFGGGNSTSRRSRMEGAKGQLQQAWNLQWEHNRNQIRYPACIGDLTWAFFDGLAGLTNIIESWGLADLYRIPKFSYYFFQSQQHRKPTVFIADYWAASGKLLNRKADLKRGGKAEDSPDFRKIVVYSNGDSVRLSVNGEVIATQTPDNGPDRPYGTDLTKGGIPFTGGDAQHLSSPPFTFKEVAFTPGMIKAVAYENGKVVATDRVYTPGTPVGIKLSADCQGVPLKAEGADAVFVRATLLDSTG